MGSEVAAGKAFLRKTNADGVSVYSHITEVLATLLAQKPENALDVLEGVSLACKQKHYSAAATVVPETPPEVPVAPSSVEASASAWHAANVSLLTPPGTVEEPVDYGEAVVKDVLAERALFECAGVGLGKEESYRVYSSLLALQQSKKLTFVRFFGKVLGTGADYYVAEATWETPPEPPEGEEPPPPPPGAPVEEHTTGCNTYVYFVTTDVAGEWTALPDVTPQQIVASKSIRKFLTGDLSADVRAYPPFPGKEKEYLRTQIARIVQATALEAVGTSVMPEEAEAGALPVANEAEDYVPTPTASLAAASGWCTKVYGILDVGRTVNPPPPEEELEEGEESKLPKPQPEIIPLTAISEAEWSTDVYEHGGPAVAIARSQLWPGAFSAYTCVGKLQTTASLYIGYGHPALSAPFAMLPPPPFQTEPDELVEQVDMPLEDENVAVVAAATAALAEEAANMEDPAAEE